MWFRLKPDGPLSVIVKGIDDEAHSGFADEQAYASVVRTTEIAKLVERRAASVKLPVAHVQPR